MRNYIKKRFFQARQGLDDESKVVIALYTSGAANDTTLAGLQISTYCSVWMNKRTCHIEYMKSTSTESMNQYYKMKQDSQDSYKYSYQGIDYYCGVAKDKLYSILGGGYQCIIIDFACDYKGIIGELLVCDKIILVTSLKPWRLQELEQCFDRIQEGYQRETIILCEKLSKGYFNWIMEQYTADFHRCNIKKLIQVPYQEEPFMASEEVLDALNQLFNKI